MTLPGVPPAIARFGWLEIILSTIAILALAMIVFFLISMMFSIGAVLTFGIPAIEAAMEAGRDRAFLRTDPVAQTVMQLIGLMLYTSLVAAVIAIAGMQRRMSAGAVDDGKAWAAIAQRVGWRDWALDRQYWLLLAGVLVYAILAGIWLEWVHPEARDWSMIPTLPIPLFLAFMLIVAVAPFCEELLFRGWIFTAMRTRLSFTATLLLTSAIFALAHFERTLLYALVVFPVGLALGYVRERYGSIKASTAFHGMYNLFAFAVTLLGIG